MNRYVLFIGGFILFCVWGRYVARPLLDVFIRAPFQGFIKTRFGVSSIVPYKGAFSRSPGFRLVFVGGKHLSWQIKCQLYLFYYGSILAWLLVIVILVFLLIYRQMNIIVGFFLVTTLSVFLLRGSLGNKRVFHQLDQLEKASSILMSKDNVFHDYWLEVMTLHVDVKKQFQKNTLSHQFDATLVSYSRIFEKGDRLMESSKKPSKKDTEMIIKGVEDFVQELRVVLKNAGLTR